MFPFRSTYLSNDRRMKYWRRTYINHKPCIEVSIQIRMWVTKRRLLSVELMPNVATGKLDNAVCPITRDTQRRLARPMPMPSLYRTMHVTSIAKIHTAWLYIEPRTRDFISPNRLHEYWTLTLSTMSKILQKMDSRYTALVLEVHTRFRCSVCAETILVTTPVHWSVNMYLFEMFQWDPKPSVNRINKSNQIV